MCEGPWICGDRVLIEMCQIGGGVDRYGRELFQEATGEAQKERSKRRPLAETRDGRLTGEIGV